MAPDSHRSYFDDVYIELYRKLPLVVVSYFNDFDKELSRKLALSVIGHISMTLIRNCKGNGP